MVLLDKVLENAVYALYAHVLEMNGFERAPP